MKPNSTHCTVEDCDSWVRGTPPSDWGWATTDDGEADCGSHPMTDDQPIAVSYDNPQPLYSSLTDPVVMREEIDALTDHLAKTMMRVTDQDERIKMLEQKLK